MTSWKEERNRLVAQTLAFVQEVAATHPAAAQLLYLGAAAGQVQPTAPVIKVPVKDARVAAAVPVPLTPEATGGAALVASSEMASERGSQVSANILTAGPSASHRDAICSVASERADIMKRVAAFKARQFQMTSEREAYYEATQSRIRTSLRNEPGRDRL